MTVTPPDEDVSGSARLFPQITANLGRVEAELRRVVHSKLPVVPEVFLHTVHAGGKRVRPALALLCGGATGEVTEATFDVAVAVELLHLASLIHDDVIDDGDRRRARRTANRIWGNKSAVLVADYTHSISYRLIAERCGREAVSRVADTVVRMVEGELSQMYNESNPEVDEAVYYQMIGDKTASLMALACELGATVSGANDEHIEQCRSYGEQLGLAFQIVDDLLDLTGDEERLGKPIGNDLRCGRMTLPLIHARQQGGEVASEVERMLGNTQLTAPELRALVALLDDAGGLAYARQAAEQLVAQARQSLADWAEGEPNEALRSLAEYVILRSQ